MTVEIEDVTPQKLFQLIKAFPVRDLEWLAKQLNRLLEEPPLPERATLDEAIDLYLADQCSLGRAAELAGLTRWDIMDTMKERGIPMIVEANLSASEIDDLAEELEAEELEAAVL